MQMTRKRKKCMEVSGGRATYRAEYEMPGLAMQLYSRHSGSCAFGGGEVHYISSCASGRITRMMLADIVGSEDVFERLSCEMRNELMRNINSIWQNRVVSNMSHQFREFAGKGGFATASVATYFAPTRSFAMCNIGNPPPLVFRARERSWSVMHGETESRLERSDQLDGVFGIDEYRHIKTKLSVDDFVVLCGNGFAHAAFPGGGMVGHNRLIESLSDSPHTDPSSRLAHLIELIQQHNPTEHDSTVLVCRVTNSKVPLRDSLLAPLRLLRRPSDDTRLT
jgi:sigma-B regulation protein RsbU (phosphoserine phosphatase)